MLVQAALCVRAVGCVLCHARPWRFGAREGGFQQRASQLKLTAFETQSATYMRQSVGASGLVAFYGRIKQAPDASMSKRNTLKLCIWGTLRAAFGV
ncbi:hypothetical protein C8Q79DRAFT_788702 [Trametes meyenii]|nr:hypothetical protein C8Q79DRAFT_788702 [Trametes meyenii]